jgi:spore coat protein U-like protein
VKRSLFTLAACACVHATGASAAQCSVDAITMNFGAYVGSQVNVAQNIRITCSATLPPPERVLYEVRLSPGLGNNYALRRMQRGGVPVDTLRYNLYLGSVPAVLDTNVWGDGTGGTRVWQGGMTLSNGQPTRTDTGTIAAAVPAGTVPSSGAYSDTVTATIIFR